VVSAREGLAASVVAARQPLVEAGAGGELPPLPKSAWLEIDLEALVSNVRLLAGLVPAGTRIEPVVKADAYGHGAVAVARALVAAGSASLCVATFDEALELRQAGIRVPILILFPIPPELAPAALRHCLSITVGDVVLAERTLAALAAMPADENGGDPQDPERRLAIHLEVETGLGRGGARPGEIAEIAAAIERNPRSRLCGLWSHLQAASSSQITADQDAQFGVACGLLEDSGMTLPTRHLVSSGGMLMPVAGAYDVVRAGIATYGLVPDGLVPAPAQAAAAAALRPVMSLRARPIRVAWLEAGWGVSYGPTFTTARRSLIATLPLGYADGFPRSLSNKAQVLVRGMRVPQVGTVAMDAIMVDVTDVPGPEVGVDDEFTLIGEQCGERISALEVAQWGNTISYEVVTAMSGRLPRVYYAAAGAVAIRTIACDASWDRGKTDVRAAGRPEEEPGSFGCE
jgi:alanine racemase